MNVREQEKRISQQEILQKYNETLRNQEQLIKQFKDKQNELYQKIEELKNAKTDHVANYDHFDFDSLAFDAKNFISNVDNKVNELINSELGSENSSKIKL